MVRVHIWLPDANHVGHTAMTVKNAYISFWPDGGADKKDLKIKRSQPGMFIASLQDDVHSEGNRHPITVELPHLNADKILDFITELQSKAPRYQLARNNCSHVIANALMAGAAAKPSFTPHAGHYSRIGRVLGFGIWTPDQILRFVKELKRDLATK
jgi:hypothetical protein